MLEFLVMYGSFVDALENDGQDFNQFMGWFDVFKSVAIAKRIRTRKKVPLLEEK